MELTHNAELVIRTKGEAARFVVRHIAKNIDEANKFVRENNGCRLFSIDFESGLLYIADEKHITPKSQGKSHSQRVIRIQAAIKAREAAVIKNPA